MLRDRSQSPSVGERTDRGPSATGPPSFGLTGTLLLVSALMGSAVTSVSIMRNDLGARQQETIRRDIEGTRLAVARRVRAAGEEVGREAESLVASPDLQRAIARRDSDAVRVALLASGRAPGWDMLLATDYLGRFLEGNGPGPGPRMLLGSPALEAAVGGEPQDVFWAIDGLAYRVRLEPVRHEGRVVGALAVGNRFDAAFLHALRGRHAAGLSVEAGGAVFGSTPGLTADAADAEATVVHSVGRMDGGEPVLLRIHPPDRAAADRAGPPWALLLGANGLWLLGTLGLGMVFLRARRASLDALTAAVERFTDGDLEAGSFERGFYEERHLAVSLERMRLALQARRDDAVEERRRVELALEEERGRGEEARGLADGMRERLVEAERYARVGRAASELSHEIRTPVATLSSSVAGLHNGLVELLHCLHRLQSSGVDAAGRRRLVGAMEDAARGTAEGVERDDARELLAHQLHHAGVADWERAARILRQGRLQAWVPRLLPLLSGEEGGACVLDALESFARLQVHLRSGATAVHLVSRLSRSLSSRHVARDDRTRLLDIRRGIEDALALLDHELGDHVRLEKNIRRLPPVQGDQEDLCQVWTNLIHNAVQAMGPRGGTLSLVASAEGGSVRVSVADTGPGISPEISDRIFDPYFSTKRREGGSGVGLAIARRIVEAHGGTISVGSTPEGTRFEVRLPAAQTLHEEMP